MIRFRDFKLPGALPLLNYVVRPAWVVLLLEGLTLAQVSAPITDE